MNNKCFFEWYQEQLKFLIYENGSLTYLFSQFVDFMDYTKEWAQNCIDFSYRVLKCSLCEFDWIDPKDNLKILEKMSVSNPVNINGYAVWETYQLHSTNKGKIFLKDCGLSDEIKEFSPVLKEKLTALFNEHGVGFDKSKFIPVQF